jgi:hypothetical protein
MIKKTVEEIFDCLISANHLECQRDVIMRIKNTFFQDLDAHLLAENQKFDFSYSFNKEEKRALRFSFNNYGEKDGFSKKIIRVFKMFNAAYNLSALRKILLFMKSSDQNHQTTIGFEWVRKSSHPRIKIYFEELHHFYSDRQKIGILRKICGLAGFDYKKISLKKHDNLAAIAIDFLPDATQNIKTYILHRDVDIFRTVAAQKCGKMLTQQLDLFLKTSLRENKRFYYETRRFIPGIKQPSLKVYKIYEIRQIGDFKNVFLEINEILRAFGMLNKADLLRRSSRICAINRLRLYPVITSIDLMTPDNPSIDVYVSIKR